MKKPRSLTPGTGTTSNGESGLSESCPRSLSDDEQQDGKGMTAVKAWPFIPKYIG